MFGKIAFWVGCVVLFIIALKILQLAITFLLPIAIVVIAAYIVYTMIRKR